MNTKKKDPWFGFTEDKMFGWVMADSDICLQVINACIPGLNAVKLAKAPIDQYEANRSQNEKTARYDVFAEDSQGRLFDIEMQVRNKNLGPRTRHYQAKLDEGSLLAGADYDDLTDSYIIFLCMFDPFGQQRRRYSFAMIDEESARRKDMKPLYLNSRAKTIIINAKGKYGKVSNKLSDVIGVI